MDILAASIVISTNCLLAGVGALIIAAAGYGIRKNYRNNGWWHVNGAPAIVISASILFIGGVAGGGWWAAESEHIGPMTDGWANMFEVISEQTIPDRRMEAVEQFVEKYASSQPKLTMEQLVFIQRQFSRLEDNERVKEILAPYTESSTAVKFNFDME